MTIKNNVERITNEQYRAEGRVFYLEYQSRLVDADNLADDIRIFRFIDRQHTSKPFHFHVGGNGDVYYTDRLLTTLERDVIRMKGFFVPTKFLLQK